MQRFAFGPQQLAIWLIDLCRLSPVPCMSSIVLLLDFVWQPTNVHKLSNLHIYLTLVCNLLPIRWQSSISLSVVKTQTLLITQQATSMRSLLLTAKGLSVISKHPLRILSIFPAFSFHFYQVLRQDINQIKQDMTINQVCLVYDNKSGSFSLLFESLINAAVISSEVKLSS